MPERDEERRWMRRLAEDRERFDRIQPPGLKEVTADLLERSLGAGTRAVALTGSTARGRRTATSDLDFHLVGARPDLAGLPGEVDAVVDTPDRFQRRLLEGDDLAQWTVRLGCVLFDPDRIFLEASARIGREDLWPDPIRKFERAEALASLAERVISIEDQHAGQEHARAGLTSLARGLLLAERVFPLARDELAAQLNGIGHAETGERLRRSIHEALDLADLRVLSKVVHREAHARGTQSTKDLGTLSEAA